MKNALRVVALGIGAVLVGVSAGAGPKDSATATADTARVAANIVNQSAGIRPGDLVLIEGGTRDQMLLEDIAVEVRKLGAHPMIVIGSDRLTLRMFTEVDEGLDTQEPKFFNRMAEFVDAIITVDYSEKDDILADIPAERRAARAKAFEKTQKKLLDRGVVRVHLGNDLYPTRTLAMQYGVPYETLNEIFWAGVNADFQQLQVLGAHTREMLSKGKHLKITAPNGTDLTVEMGSTPVFVSDGVVSSEDRYDRGPACQVWLPAGEVYFAPKPKTAEGTFVADTFYYEGKKVEGLTLKFTKGKLTSMTARSDITALKELYDAAPKGREMFGAIDIGINPAVTTPQGSSLVTWIGSGTISVGIGGDIWAGGENEVPYGLYAHVRNGTLAVDGRKIVDGGTLRVK